MTMRHSSLIIQPWLEWGIYACDNADGYNHRLQKRPSHYQDKCIKCNNSFIQKTIAPRSYM